MGTVLDPEAQAVADVGELLGACGREESESPMGGDTG